MYVQNLKPDKDTLVYVADQPVEEVGPTYDADAGALNDGESYYQVDAESPDQHEVSTIKNLLFCRAADLDGPHQCCVFLVVPRSGEMTKEAVCIPEEEKPTRSPPGFAEAY